MIQVHPPTDEHNYLKALKEACDRNPPEAGKVYDTAVRHDDWCDIYKRGFCNCKPEIVMIDLSTRKPQMENP